MTTRELPTAEWPRLAGTTLDSVWQSLSPESATVIVVEDEGQIVGHVALMTMVHVEGLAVNPAYRSRGSVWRRLLHAVGQKTRLAGLASVIAGSASEEMAGYLQRLGAVPMPARFWTLPTDSRFFREETPCLRP